MTVLFLGCASTRLSPVKDAEFKPERDEQDLWAYAKMLDQRLDEMDVIYADDELETYVSEVATGLLPHLGAGDVDVRVLVLKDPFLNAFALPNGSVYLHSGILARMDNEAQLATVLGHELTHYLRRHSLKQMRTEKNRRTAAQVVTGILAVAMVAASGNPSAARTMLDLTGPLSNTIVKAQVRGYSRDLEREADERGLAAMKAAGYDGNEAPEVFRRILQEKSEADIEEPYFFGSHPRMEERIESYESALAKVDPNGRPEASAVYRERFMTAVSDLLLENARLDMNMRRMTKARAAIEKHIAFLPSSAAGNFALGELHRRWGDEPEHVAAALDAYEKTIRIEPDHARARRELGLLLRANGQKDRARAELERYLELEPEAVDRPIVESYVVELAGETVK